MTVTIDVGTTAVKVHQFDDQGSTLYKGLLQYETQYKTSGSIEQNPDDVIMATFTLLNQLHDLKHEEIVISSAMHSLMVTDQHVKPVSPLMIWADRRAESVIETFKKTDQADLFYKKTHTPIHPMSPFAKLLWMTKTEAGQAFRKQLPEQVYYLDIKTYLWYHLTGVLEVDLSIGSATGLVDIKQKTYDQDILTFLHLDSKMLPKLVEPTLKRNLDPPIHVLEQSNVEVMIGSSDGVLANISEPGFKGAHLTLGTSGAIRITTGEPYVDPEGRLFCYYLNDETWVVGGANNNGGNVLRWLDEILYETKGKIYEVISTLDFNEVDPSLIFLPHLNGERAPLWDTSRRGSLIGLAGHHKKEDLIKATLLGICFNLKHTLDHLMSLVGSVEEIQLSGGVFSIPQVPQLTADVMGLDVLLSDTIEQSSIGALRLINPSVKENSKKSKLLPDTDRKESFQTMYQDYLTHIK